MSQPIRHDEVALRLAVMRNEDKAHNRDGFIHRHMHIPEKRAAWLFEKWSLKGWWDWGVSPRTGWLTEEGRAAFREWAGDRAPTPEQMRASDPTTVTVWKGRHCGPSQWMVRELLDVTQKLFKNALWYGNQRVREPCLLLVGLALLGWGDGYTGTGGDR